MNISTIRKKLDIMKALNDAPDTVQVKQTSTIIEYKRPSLSLLKTYKSVPAQQSIDPKDLEQTLSDFGFETHVEAVKTGPMITQYELKLAKIGRASCRERV